mgnify:CR=1 FL=1
MRIVVSGTHASGKSTLISDFVLRHPEFTVLPDPFELLDEADDSPRVALFAAQLRIAAQRLRELEPGAKIIAERGPIDFLAYLLASAELADVPIDDEFGARAVEMTADAMSHVDLLVVLPLTAQDAIPVGSDEHPELRVVMDEILPELVDDPDVVGDGLVVIEITGEPSARVAALEALL